MRRREFITQRHGRRVRSGLAAVRQFALRPSLVLRGAGQRAEGAVCGDEVRSVGQPTGATGNAPGGLPTRRTTILNARV
jgi:hypothetical protein